MGLVDSLKKAESIFVPYIYKFNPRAKYVK